MNNVYDLKMPQFGEGMHYAKVINILCKPGDHVDEDTNVIVVETDKTSIEIPSPMSGHILEIFCEEGEVIDVGKPLVSITSPLYTEKKDISFGQERRSQRRRVQENITHATTAPHSKIHPIQKILIENLKFSAQNVTPAQVEMRLNWDKFKSLRSYYLTENGKRISTSALICWACAQAMFINPKARAKIVNNEKLNISERAHIGLAMAGEEDTITVPVITTHKKERPQDVEKSLDIAKNQNQQTQAYHSLTITNMIPYGVHSGTPVVISPCVATLFIGAPYWGMNEKDPHKHVKYCNIILAFDHRVINGVYAAKLLKDFKNFLTFPSQKDNKERMYHG